MSVTIRALIVGIVIGAGEMWILTMWWHDRQLLKFVTEEKKPRQVKVK